MEIAGGQESLRRYFRTRTETGGLIAGAFFVLVLLSATIYAFSHGDVTGGIGMSLFLLLISLLGWPIRYGLDEERMTWHFGLATNHSIRYKDIDLIVPAEGRDGYTLGKIKGHQIVAGKRKAFFSAESQDALLTELERNCPHLRRYGDSWRRELSALQDG